MLEGQYGGRRDRVDETRRHLLPIRDRVLRGRRVEAGRRRPRRRLWLGAAESGDVATCDRVSAPRDRSFVRWGTAGSVMAALKLWVQPDGGGLVKSTDPNLVTSMAASARRDAESSCATRSVMFTPSRPITDVDWCRLASGAAAVGLATTPSASTPFGGGTGRILYMKGGDLYTANLDGQQVRRLTEDPVRNEFSADWSSDGSRIVYRVNPTGSGLVGGEIHTMQADGSQKKNLTRNRASDWSPAWSPDDRMIAFASSRGGGLINVWIMNASGSGLRQVTSSWGEYPTWSPNGQRLAFMAYRHQNYDIYVANADRSGGAERRLTRARGDDGFPDWSPDGRLIAFTSERAGLPQLYTMRPDGSRQRRLATVPANEPHWTPDGRWLTFALGRPPGGVYAIRREGRDLHQLLPGPLADPTLQPRKARSRGPALPDPSPRDGVDAVIDAFDTRAVVAVGEEHGSTDEHKFLQRLIEDPRFPVKADDIVVEFGNARFQRLIDRYIAGGYVAPGRLRAVWEQTTQRGTGVWDSPIYARFFEIVRRVNRRLPARERLRVLLGDPPIDWSRIRKDCHQPERDWRRPTCIDYWYMRRDSHFAKIVRRNVLARSRKGLLIAGASHFLRPPSSWPGDRELPLVGLIERTYPSSVWIVFPYSGFVIPQPRVDRLVAGWPPNSIAAIRGTWVGSLPASVLIGKQASRPGQPRRPDPRARGLLSARIDALLKVQ